MVIIKGVYSIKRHRFKNKEKEEVRITLYEEEKITHLVSPTGPFVIAL